MKMEKVVGYTSNSTIVGYSTNLNIHKITV